MESLLTLIVVLAAGFSAYYSAKAQGQWSWPAFFWILGVLLVYAGFSTLVVLAVMPWASPDNPGLGTLVILLAIGLGVVPVSIVAKRIQRHYVKSAK